MIHTPPQTRRPAGFDGQDGSVSDLSSTREVRMPTLMAGQTAGRLVRWHVDVGQEIAPGDVIADIATDNATIEVEAEEAGRISGLLREPGGEPIEVGAPIALIAVGDGARGDGARGDGARGDGAGRDGATPADGIDIPDGFMSSVHADRAKRPDRPALAEARAPQARSAPVAATRSDAAGDERDPDRDTSVRNLTLRVALREALKEEMERDQRVVIFGEDICDDENTYKVTYGLKAAFGPQRVRNVPVTEAGFTGLAIGAALAGLKPVVEFQHFSYALQAIDQIVNTAAKMRYLSSGRLNVPIVLRGPNGAGARTGAQSSQNVAAWFAGVPGLVVAAPASAADAKGLLKQAIRSADPVVILETERLYGRVGPVPDVTDHLCPFGSAAIVKPGTTVTLVSYGGGVSVCLDAAKRLAADGIDAEVIDLRCLRPLDTETLYQSVRKTNRVVTVEEAWPACGIGAELSARIMTACFEDLDAPPTRVTGADVPMPYAANLERLALPSASDVVLAAKKVCYQ